MNIQAAFKIQRGAFTLAAELDLPTKGVTAIFGPSGSGKTTLLRLIAGLERDVNGYLKIGDDIWQDQETFLPTHERGLGYVFQEDNLLSHLSVKGNIEYGWKRSSKEPSRKSLQKAVELLDIEGLLKRKPDTLSGGERQRVAIARALAASPKLLLMDEPLAALDKARKEEILPFIDSLRQSLDIPLIYVTHASDEIARLADYLVLMEKGSPTATGEINSLLTRLDLPLSHSDDAESLVEASVCDFDEQYSLNYLQFSAGQFIVTGKKLQSDSRVRLRIAARDVSLALNPPNDTSILNVFPAAIDKMTPKGGSQMTIRLKIGECPILCRITRKSVDKLALAQGDLVYAQIKSVAVMR